MLFNRSIKHQSNHNLQHKFCSVSMLSIYFLIVFHKYFKTCKKIIWNKLETEHWRWWIKLNQKSQRPKILLNWNTSLSMLLQDNNRVCHGNSNAASSHRPITDYFYYSSMTQSVFKWTVIKQDEICWNVHGYDKTHVLYKMHLIQIGLKKSTALR